MAGDGGTIIPEHLTRPLHWPQLEELGDVDESVKSGLVEKDKDEQNAQARPLVLTVEQRRFIEPFAQASTVEFALDRSGKIDVGDKPYGAGPEIVDQEDLRKRWRAQKTFVQSLIESFEVETANFNTTSIVSRLSKYCEVLEQEPHSWYEPDAAVSRLRTYLGSQDEGALDGWGAHNVADLKELFKKHDEMRILLKPKEHPQTRPDLPDLEVDTPESSQALDGLEGGLAELLEEAKVTLMATQNTLRLILDVLEELKEARKADAYSPAEEAKKSGRIKSAAMSAVKVVGKFLFDIASMATAGYIIEANLVGYLIEIIKGAF